VNVITKAMKAAASYLGFGKGNVERGALSGPYSSDELGEMIGGRAANRVSAYSWMKAVLASPIVRPVITRISTDISCGDWYISGPGKNGKRERIEDDSNPAVKFLQSPWTEGAGGTWQQVLELGSNWYESTGSCFLLKDFAPGGRMRGVIPIPTTHCTVEQVYVPGSLYSVENWFRVSVPGSGKSVRIPASDMIWIRDPNWTDPNGPAQGIVSCLNDEVSQDENAAKYNNSFFANGATPHAVVSIQRTGIEQSELDKLKLKWTKEHVGVTNAFRTLFLAGDVKVNPFQSSHKEMQFVEMRKLIRELVLMVWQMPAAIMGLAGSVAPTPEEMKYYQSLCLRPRMKKFCDALNNQVFRKHFGLFRLEFVNPVREFAKDLLEKVTFGWNNGLIDMATACEKLDFPAPPDKIAKLRMVPGNMFLMDDKGEMVASTTTPTGTEAAPKPGGKTPETTPGSPQNKPKRNAIDAPAEDKNPVPSLKEWAENAALKGFFNGKLAANSLDGGRREPG